MPRHNKLLSRTPVRWVALIPLAVLSLASGVAQAQAAAPASGMASGHMQTASMPKDGAAAHDMKQSMMAGMDGMQKMPMSGDVDKDFAAMMKMHHQQAVSMAEMELAHGKSPAMKNMARQIMSAQKKEMATFDKWLTKQK